MSYNSWRLVTFKSEDLLNLTVALFICCNPIAWALAFLSGGLFIIVGVLWIMYVIYCCFKHTTIFSIVPFSIAILITVFLIFQTVFLPNEYLYRYITGFAGFGILGMLLGYSQLNIKNILEWVCKIGIVLSPFILTMDMGKTITGGDDYGKWMAVSYGILRFICAEIIVLVFYEIKRIWRFAIIISLISFFIFYLFFASRGCVVALIVLALMILIIKSKSNLFKYKLLIYTGIISLIILLFFDKILTVSIEVMSSINIDAFFLQKMLDMIESGSGLSNGRDYLYSSAFDGISNSPLFGNGIGTFETKHGIYIHNLFLQILYESGIIPFIGLIGATIYSIKRIFNISAPRDQRIFLAFLFCSGVFELIFSSTFWMSHLFWIWIGYISSICLNRTVCKYKYIIA